MNDTLWLTLTNLALGFVVLVAVTVVGAVFAGELHEKFSVFIAKYRTDAHGLYVHDLGMTFSDGGEKETDQK